jgi:hypothetical protein
MTDDSCTPDPAVPEFVHVNAYAVDRCYGGPEEGGWYYDDGRPLGSIMVRNSDEAIDAAKALLRERFTPEFEENLEIYVEDDVAAHFPAERPHYE